MRAYENIIEKVSAYIEDNLDKEIDLEMIAESVGYSRFHLNRIFAEQTGCTIYKYLQERRLTVAAGELVKTEKPIAQIALEVGYHSQQAFSLAFRQVYDCPPKAYRDRGIFAPKRNRISMHLGTKMGRYGLYGRIGGIAA